MATVKRSRRSTPACRVARTHNESEYNRDYRRDSDCAQGNDPPVSEASALLRAWRTGFPGAEGLGVRDQPVATRRDCLDVLRVVAVVSENLTDSCATAWLKVPSETYSRRQTASVIASLDITSP